MNNELLQRIIEEVVSRLKKRAESTLTLSVAQLRKSIHGQYAASTRRSISSKWTCHYWSKLPKAAQSTCRW